MKWAVALGETFHASVWPHRLGFGGGGLHLRCIMQGCGMVVFRAGRCPEGTGAREARPHSCTRTRACPRTGAGPELLPGEVGVRMALHSVLLRQEEEIEL